jgi:hypothetical protein
MALPSILGKTGHCRRRLAKADERARIARNPGKTGYLAVFLNALKIQ